MASSIDNSDNFMVTGLEIVPYVPPESKGDEGFNIPRKETPIIIPLVKVTQKREEVEKGSNEDMVKAVPISFKLPKQCFANILRMDQDQASDSIEMHSMQCSTRNICTAGPITFKLPEDCVDYTFKLDEEEQRVSLGVGCLSLFERLEGWTIERRQRENKRFDKFYYHGMSNKMFRSFAEVVRFIIYGLHPQKPHRLNEKKSQEGLLVNGTESSRRTTFKRKRAPQTFVEEPIIETVEEMLGKAYQNMQNSCNVNTQKETMCSLPQDCGEETLETIEEILHEANQNLLNLFNTEVVEAQGNGKETTMG